MVGSTLLGTEVAYHLYNGNGLGLPGGDEAVAPCLWHGSMKNLTDIFIRKTLSHAWKPSNQLVQLMQLIPLSLHSYGTLTMFGVLQLE